jgi:dihydroorotase
MAIPHRPLLLTEARLVDPETGYDAFGGVLIEDGRIRAFGPDIRKETIGRDAHMIDCRGLTVAPGVIDLRVFIGEPGQESRETLASASAAAAAGGVTTALMMPNTAPAVDDPAVIDFIIRRAQDQAKIRILPAGALSKGCAGHEMAELGLLAEAGAVAFTDGLYALRNPRLFRRILQYAKPLQRLIIQHIEDAELVGTGVMHEGVLSTRLGLPGIPVEAETVQLERDIRLAAGLDVALHAAVVSTAQSVDILRSAKASGVSITAGTSINHLSFNDHDVVGYRTFFKLSPPLRPEADRLALIEGIKDGTIDCIVSDHQPQGTESKRQPFIDAAAGAIGIETLLSAGLRLVHAGTLSLHALLKPLTFAPAKILNLPQGRLQRGAPADLAVFDMDEPWVVERRELRSRSKNATFNDARLSGRVRMTIVAGRIVFSLAQ